MVVEFGYKKGENTFSKQKIQFWLNSEMEIHWHAYIWYISQYMEISDFTEDTITIDIHSIGDYDFFVETTKDYNDILCRHNYNLAMLSGHWWISHKNPNLNKEIVERLVNMDSRTKDT